MFRSPRARRTLVAIALPTVAVAALGACNPVLVPLAGETRLPSCVSGSPFGPIRYEGPNDAVLDIFVTSPDDPSLSSRSLQVALGFQGELASAANAVRMGTGRHTDYTLLASQQTISVEVCSADGTDIGDYRYHVLMQTRGRHSQERVGTLRSTS